MFHSPSPMRPVVRPTASADVVDHMHHDRAYLLRLGPDAAHQVGGQAVAHVHADDDGENAAEAHAHGAGEGLQDADHRRGALDDAGDQGAGQKAQQVVALEGGEQPAQSAAEGADRVAHENEPHEQDAKADGDGADVFGGALFHEHEQDDAQYQRQRREVLRVEEVEQAGGASLYVHEPDDLGGDGGAHVGAQHDADGLTEGEKARAHQAHGQHDGGRRALYHAGDQHAQHEPQGRLCRHLFQRGLHGAAGAAFQPVAHHPHAVQEHGQSAQQGDQFVYQVHTVLRLLSLDIF